MLTVERKQRVNITRRNSGSITSEEGAIQTEKEGQPLLSHKPSPPLEDPEDDSLFEGLFFKTFNSLSPILNCVDFHVAGLAILRCK